MRSSDDDLAVAHVQAPWKGGGDLLVVGDQHQRRAVGRELVQQLDHRAAGLGVEVAGWLVGEQDHRTLGDRARDRDALALAAGQLCGRCVARWPSPTRSSARTRPLARRCPGGMPV